MEQSHREALDAQALVYVGKVKKLEEQILKLSKEKDTLNGTLVEAHDALISKAGELSEANNSIRDLKLKLEDLEKMMSEAKAREGTLTKDLETEKQLRRNEAANLNNHVKGEKCWLGRLASLRTRPPRYWPPWGCRM